MVQSGAGVLGVCRHRDVAREGKSLSPMAMRCWRAAGNVDGATSVGDLEEVWSNMLLSSRERRNASRHVADKSMEQDVQWVLDELGDGRNVLFDGSLVCED